MADNKPDNYCNTNSIISVFVPNSHYNKVVLSLEASIIKEIVAIKPVLYNVHNVLITEYKYIIIKRGSLNIQCCC